MHLTIVYNQQVIIVATEVKQLVIRNGIYNDLPFHLSDLLFKCVISNMQSVLSKEPRSV